MSLAANNNEIFAKVTFQDETRRISVSNNANTLNELAAKCVEYFGLKNFDIYQFVYSDADGDKIVLSSASEIQSAKLRIEKKPAVIAAEKKAEAAKKVEAAKKAAEAKAEAAKKAAETKAAEVAKKVEAEPTKKVDEAKKAAEAEKAESAKKAQAEKAEAAKKAAEAKSAEAAKKAAEVKAEAAKKAAEAKEEAKKAQAEKAEAAKKAAEAKAEAAKKAAEAKAEAAKKAAEAKAEAAKKAAEAKAEAAKNAAEAKVEAAKKAAEAKKAEAAKKAAEAKNAEAAKTNPSNPEKAESTPEETAPTEAAKVDAKKAEAAKKAAEKKAEAVAAKKAEAAKKAAELAAKKADVSKEEATTPAATMPMLQLKPAAVAKPDIKKKIVPENIVEFKAVRLSWTASTGSGFLGAKPDGMLTLKAKPTGMRNIWFLKKSDKGDIFCVPAVAPKRHLRMVPKTFSVELNNGEFGPWARWAFTTAKGSSTEAITSLGEIESVAVQLVSKGNKNYVIGIKTVEVKSKKTGETKQKIVPVGIPKSAADNTSFQIAATAISADELLFKFGKKLAKATASNAATKEGVQSA